MKRGTPRHPKTLALANHLSLERWGAVGVLESLWHFAQEYAKRGDVGRFTDADIARGMEWSGDHSKLIEALSENRWLDRCPCHRLRVHDWPSHADAGVHNSAEVKSRGFLECYESLPDVRNMIVESSGVQPATATAMATAEKGNGNVRDPLELMLSVFNATFGTRKKVLGPYTRRFRERCRTYKTWQMVAAPLLIQAQGTGSITVEPRFLFQDGEHARRTKAGFDAGGTDWVERAFERAATTVLDERLTAIAMEADRDCPGLAAGLEHYGVAFTRNGDGS